MIETDAPNPVIGLSFDEVHKMIADALVGPMAETSAAKVLAASAEAKAASAEAKAASADVKAASSEAKAASAEAKADVAMRTVVNPLAIRRLLDDAKAKCQSMTGRSTAGKGMVTQPPSWSYALLSNSIFMSTDLETIFVSRQNSARGRRNRE